MDPTNTPDNPILNSKSMEEHGMIQFRRKPKFPSPRPHAECVCHTEQVFRLYHDIVNQAQIQEELGVSEVVCEWLDTHRRLDTERVLHHT